MNDSVSSVDNEGVGLLKVPCEQRGLVVGAEHSYHCEGEVTQLPLPRLFDDAVSSTGPVAVKSGSVTTASGVDLSVASQRQGPRAFQASK
jgi:hypothetical protein